MGYVKAKVLIMDDIARIWASGGSVDKFGAYFNFLLSLAERKPILFPRSEMISQVPKSSFYPIVSFPVAIELSSSGL